VHVTAVIIKISCSSSSMFFSYYIVPAVLQYFRLMRPFLTSEAFHNVTVILCSTSISMDSVMYTYICLCICECFMLQLWCNECGIMIIIIIINSM